MARRFPPGGRKGPEPTLPESELDVMRMIWKHGKATARDVWTGLAAEGSKWTYATVNTLLQRLEAKGHVDTDKSQMYFTYYPATDQKKEAKKRYKEVADKFFDGSVGQLVGHVLKYYKHSDEEKKEIRSALAGKVKGGE